jgi:chemotaxis protein MotB
LENSLRKKNNFESEVQLKLVHKSSESAEQRELEQMSHYKKNGSSHADEGEGSWLVSYADMMTLLVGFFVMLFSFSKIDSNEFEKVKKETTKVFGGEYQKPFEKLSGELKKVLTEQKLTDQVLLQESDAGIILTFRGALFFESASSNLRSQASDL